MRARFLPVLMVAVGWVSAARAVTMDWVTVGNPGNTPDPIGYGSVGYLYQIGKNEVTNSQYVEFLNAKAASDPLGLYNTGMTSDSIGGINRSGAPGTYSYTVKGGRGNQPVVYVSWYDAIRFANWMHNGQGGGATETGAYTILGGTSIPSNADTIQRNPGANVFLPSQDEWVKAAYHQPAAAGGDPSNYWAYPTRSNTITNSDQPPGAAAVQTNVANFNRDDGVAMNGYNDGFAVTGTTAYNPGQNYLTNVGAYLNAPSFYGTFDQGGNVWEWNDTLVFFAGFNYRAVGGGAWNFDSSGLRSDPGWIEPPAFEVSTDGFRVATIPEPACGLFVAALAALARRRRKGN